MCVALICTKCDPADNSKLVNRDSRVSITSPWSIWLIDSLTGKYVKLVVNGV